MFTKARLTLTTWYVLVIMFISISFSAVIYRMLSTELERFAHMQQTRIERRFQETMTVRPFIPPPDPELVAETKHRLILFLVIINGAIIIISGGLGYILAGKTLQPIATMLTKQRQFISDASHELKTPITSLTTALEVTLRDPHITLQKAKAVMKENIEDLNNLQTLSNHLLELSQYETGIVSLTKVPCRLERIILHAVHIASPLADKKHITITADKLAGTILGNEASLVDVFVILLDNAIQYSSEHSTVTVQTKTTDGTIIASVEDHGIGIDAKHVLHIFDRFYRVDRSRSKTTKGYGLGLAIAKQILALHNASITVDSAPKKGSTFQVSFRKS